MKEKRKLSRRELLLSCGLLFFFALAVCLIFMPQKDSAQFERFSEKLYLMEMTSDTLSLHYSLAHPENFGITEYPVALPCYLPGAETKQSDTIRPLMEELRSISREKLSEENAYACDCMETYLLQTDALSRFPYYAEPLSPSHGMHSQLPILLSEYDFRTKRDVTEYLTLLGQTGDYLTSLLYYEREKAAAGMLMSLESLRETQKQCDTIVTFDSLEKGTHFLQTGFAERLAELSSKEPLSPKETDDFRAQNDALLREIVLPAYQALKAGLQNLEPFAAEETLGLAALPSGREYYRALLKRETGSEKTPEQIRSLLEKTLITESETIRQLAADYPGCLPSLREESYASIGISDGYVMLEDLQKRMEGAFPAPISASGQSPSVLLKSVSESLQDSSAPAFYLTAPMDNTDRNVIYINPKNPPKELELYVTLAHEGYPGHLYQNTYTSAHFLSMGESRIRQLLHCGGYLEGWALYVEQLSYDYCSALLCEQGRAADAVCVQLEKHNRSLQLCLYSLLDLMIHYQGATPEEAWSYLSAFGLKSPSAANRLYQYICQSPCNYPKYYLGYLEILELQQAARELWGPHYSDLSFHTFLLQWGPADFGNLRRRLSSYSFS